MAGLGDGNHIPYCLIHLFQTVHLFQTPEYIYKEITGPRKYAPLKPKAHNIFKKKEFRKERHIFKFKKEVQKKK